MHSVKVTFNDDCKHRQHTVARRQRRRERDTDDLGHCGARLGRDEGDQVEGEGLTEMPTILGQRDEREEGLWRETHVDDGFQGPEGSGDRRRQEELGGEGLRDLPVSAPSRV